MILRYLDRSIAVTRLKANFLQQDAADGFATIQAFRTIIRTKRTMKKVFILQLFYSLALTIALLLEVRPRMQELYPKLAGWTEGAESSMLKVAHRHDFRRYLFSDSIVLIVAS